MAGAHEDGGRAVAGSPSGAGIFMEDDLDGVVTAVDRDGYAVLRGAIDEGELSRAEAELVAAQEAVATGGDAAHATDILDEPDAVVDGRPFAHYVTFATRVCPAADRLARLPDLVTVATGVLGPAAWLLDDDVFGVVYQDARPGPTSGYSRIGWHTDRQSGPHLAVWPALAFTVHFDPTSPANGFLRVLPGSHRRSTDGMPAAFGRVPGEVAVYAERGDVIFHHCDLWHAAARATADGGDAIRRHLRGSWHGGERLEPGHGTDDFVKNAAR